MSLLRLLLALLTWHSHHGWGAVAEEAGRAAQQLGREGRAQLQADGGKQDSKLKVTYLLPALRFGPNNQKRDLRFTLALAQQLGCGVLLTGLTKHYSDRPGRHFKDALQTRSDRMYDRGSDSKQQQQQASAGGKRTSGGAARQLLEDALPAGGRQPGGSQSGNGHGSHEGQGVGEEWLRRLREAGAMRERLVEEEEVGEGEEEEEEGEEREQQARVALLWASQQWWWGGEAGGRERAQAAWQQLSRQGAGAQLPAGMVHQQQQQEGHSQEEAVSTHAGSGASAQQRRRQQPRRGLQVTEVGPEAQSAALRSSVGLEDQQQQAGAALAEELAVQQQGEQQGEEQGKQQQQEQLPEPQQQQEQQQQEQEEEQQQQEQGQQQQQQQDKQDKQRQQTDEDQQHPQHGAEGMTASRHSKDKQAEGLSATPIKLVRTTKTPSAAAASPGPAGDGTGTGQTTPSSSTTKQSTAAGGAEAGKEAEGRSSSGSSSKRPCLRARVKSSLMEADEVLDLEALRAFVPVATPEQLRREEGWDGTIDLLVHSNKHRLKQYQKYLDQSVQSANATLAPDVRHLQLSYNLGCNEQKLADIRKDLQGYRVVAVVTVFLSNWDHYDVTKEGWEAPPGVCPRAMFEANRLLRPSALLRDIADRFIHAHFAGSNGAFVAIHLRPYPDECLLEWMREGPMDSGKLNQRCHRKQRGMDRRLVSCALRRLRSAGHRSLFVMTHPGLYQRVQDLFDQSKSGVQPVFISNVANYSECTDASSSFLALVEDAIALRAQYFIGTSQSSITESVVLGRMGLLYHQLQERQQQGVKAAAGSLDNTITFLDHANPQRLCSVT